MKLATTTGDFRDCDYYKQIQLLHDAGFRYIDLSMYSPMKDDPLLLREDWREAANKLRVLATSRGMTFVQAHSPAGNPLDEEKLDELVAITVRSIEVCGALGIPNIVVHAGWERDKAKDVGKEEYFERNRAFFRRLFPAMEVNGVNVLVENSTRANMGTRYYLYTGADMRAFIEYVDHPLFHGCWDTGHGNCEGGQYDQLVALGEHLYGVHINDNRGERDEHLLPFFGTLNMDDVMHGLLDAGYKGVFTFEASSSLRPAKYWLGKRRPFGRDTRLAEPALFMQEELERLLYRMGVYILKSYDCFEE